MTVPAIIFEQIERVAATPSKKDKQALLSEALSDPRSGGLLKALLFWCYSSSHRYGIKFVEPKTTPGGVLTAEDGQFWAVLTGLSERQLTGNAARESIARLMEQLDEPSAELFRRVVHKDMRAGFTEATLNKIIPKWIKEPPYMRCSLIKDVKLDKWEWDDGLYLQLKADGMYQRAVRSGDVISMESRSGEVMPIADAPDFKQIYEDLLRTMPDVMAFDGELLVVDSKGEVLNRAEGNGMLNSVRQGGRLEEGYQIVYRVWDAVDQGLSDTPETYEQRFEVLQHCFNGSGECQAVGIIETHLVYTKDQVRDWVRKWMLEGKEGGVLKRGKGLWKDGTSKDQIKLKLSAQIEVKVTGFKPGAKGKKHEKTFGALEYETDCGLLRGSVTGIADKLRKEIDENRDDWMGAIITVEANDITQGRDDGDYWALSHPRFIERRTDKTTADTLARAKEIFEDARSSFLN